MVVSKDASDNSPVYDVVFVVEKTANIVPYFDTLMKSYILPTLEYFNNGPADATDYGTDYSCTLYTVVTFHAGDIAPEPAATCNIPTNSIHEVITYLEELDFLGGAAQGSSHIAEGLSTALQVFDNIKTIRHKGINTQRHCILVCNSPPYHMGAEESNHDYRGFNSEQLASMLGKRGIHLSVISPRKIAALQKMFDAAGAGEGSYSGHLQKDYTTDPRHMVLLHGYQLQERSHSPAGDEDTKVDINKVGGASGLSPAPNSMAGTDGQFKVPSSVIPSQAGGMQSSGQPPNQVTGSMIGGPGGPMGPGMHPGQHMPSHSQPPGMPSQIASMLQNQSPGQRMSGPHSMAHVMNDQQKAAVYAHANSMVQGDKSSVMVRGPVSQGGMMPPGSVPMSTQGMMMVPPGSQASMMAQQQQMMQQQMPQQGSGMVMNPTNPMTSQPMGMPGGPPNPGMMPNSIAMSQAQVNFPPGSGQMTIGPRASVPGSGPMSQNPGFPGMPASTAGPSGATSTVGSGPGAGDLAGVDPNSGMRQQMPPTLRDRKVVWTGALEYQEKSKGPLGQVGNQQKITWLLSCRISIANSEPDLSTMNWPEKLSLQLLPQNMLSELQTLCRNSRQVAFHFSNTDQDALRNLHKLMGTGFAGCVHFPPQSAAETRIILLLFSVKKRAFIGLIPNDQSAFVQGIKNVLTQHKMKTPGAKGMLPGMSQAGMNTMGQTHQNLPQGQGGAGMDANTLTGQPAMVTATTGPGGGAGGPAQAMMSTPGGPNNPAMQQMLAAKRGMQFGQQQQQQPGDPKSVATMRQQQQQQQLMDHDMFYPGHPYMYHHAQQQIRQQQQQQGMPGQRMPMQPVQPPNPQQMQLRQMLQQQQMRQQILMHQQHGRAPGPQNQPGVMPPGGQPGMQGMGMGQMPGPAGQNFNVDDFNFQDLM